MAEHVIPVDLFNPGQLFACLGFLEAAEILLSEAEGGFDWSRETEEGVKFRLRAAGEENPVGMVLEFLAEAQVKAIAPAKSEHRTEKWKVSTAVLREGEPFPLPDPPSPATLPAVLKVSGKRAIQLDHWGDATLRDNVKFWAGAAGYPGAGLARDALDLIRTGYRSNPDQIRNDPFSFSVPQSSSFRFDWRRDYIPLEIGFSPNEHRDVRMIGFPAVEVLAAIGLTHARPQRLTKLEYRYGAAAGAEDGALLDPTLLRATFGCTSLPFPQRRFRMHLGWPGKENQARCIIDVTEEPTS